MAQGNHDQSIGTTTDQPVDGIAGSHAGTQEPAGAHVDAGKTRHGSLQREEGNQQSEQPVPGSTAGKAAARTGSFAHVNTRGMGQPGSDGGLMGSQGAGSAFQGGSGASMQGGAEARIQRLDDVAHAGAPGGTLQHGDLVQRGSAGSRGN